jgi:hypothetical protein
MLKLLVGEVLGAVRAILFALVVHVQNAFRVVTLRRTHFGAVDD